MSAPESVIKLVETFAMHRQHYTSNSYNETELRREFLDPFFKALGWDIDNESGYADAYKDVIHEDAIKIGGFTKAPDYCFRIGGQRKFFLEAKKPAVKIKTDTEPAYQLRRYAWSAKLPLSILSDFEELAVYDCRVRPQTGDKASTARILFFNFEEYVDRWDEIESIFSREAVLKGSFDKYAEEAKKKRGTAEVDDAFLEEIERWRGLLARNLALRNSDLSVSDLNYSVQKIIDRIIFLRICEDRGTEDYGRLAELIHGSDSYGRLLEEFRRADDRYNSGLFHLQAEKGRSGVPDNLTPTLSLDDKIVKDIIKNLYYPDSPYEFSVLPADILGQVYEQFLGRTIRLTYNHQAKIEEKPEVRKAGGVYYTPKHIVEYIVEETLGRLLNGPEPSKPRPIPVSAAEKIKVVDPACGSGSFLIVAYQYLLDWHRDQYSMNSDTLEEDPGKIKRHSAGKAPKIYQAKGGEWKLTTAERKRILLNNIFGIDIDSQAVEVTKLSLLLKVLEGETQQNLQRDFLMERQRILPDLGDNIRCGNSLIGPDLFDNDKVLLLNEEIENRINPFDWQTAFPEIMSSGGFDCVIGNPPYVFTRDGGFTEVEKSFYYENYFHQSAQLNTFGLFMEKALTLLAPDKFLGFIVPNNWLSVDSFSKLRQFILETTGDLSIVNIRDRVFGANVDTAIITTRNKEPTKIKIGEMENSLIQGVITRDVSDFRAPSFIFSVAKKDYIEIEGLLNKIESVSTELSDVATVSTGLKVYQKGKGRPQQTNYEKENRVFHSVNPLTPEHGKYLEGADVRRYNLRWSGTYLRYGDWIAEPRRSVPFSGPRILVRQIPSSPPLCIQASMAFDLSYNDINSMVVFDSNVSLYYILGILNSKLISFWFVERFQKFQRKIFPQFKVKELKIFPIKMKASNDEDNALTEEQISQLVERMIRLKKEEASERNPESLRLIKMKLINTDRQLDRLIYNLYGLTSEEINLVEATLEKPN